MERRFYRNLTISGSGSLTFHGNAVGWVTSVVEVTDDGVGFDTDAPIDEKKHVGLRNIRGRLKAMVNGDLVLESKPGIGTKAMIMIPKEVTV